MLFVASSKYFLPREHSSIVVVVVVVVVWIYFTKDQIINATGNKAAIAIEPPYAAMALLPFSFLLPALSGSTLTFNWRAVVVEEKAVAVNAGWTRVGRYCGASGVAVVRTTTTVEEEEEVKAAACCREHTTRRRSATIE